jgi:hypothetical protein
MAIGVNMNRVASSQGDSNAWIFQTWVSFFMSVGLTASGILYLPVDSWVKGFMGMGLTFSVASSFSLAKTQRDLHESHRIVSKIEEARVEELLSKHP